MSFHCVVMKSFNKIPEVEVVNDLLSVHVEYFISDFYVKNIACLLQELHQFPFSERLGVIKFFMPGWGGSLRFKILRFRFFLLLM